MRTTREWLRTEQINFDLDLGDPQDLVDAVQANLETRASYYEAVQRYNVAVLRLLRTAGTLPQEAERGMLIEQ
jgi:predicted RNA-binding protein associated with RNAse of E/G family